MRKLVNTKDMPRDEWLAWRRKGIGGSDAGAILGLNPWFSAIACWQDKTGKRPPKDEPSEAMRLGSDLEDYVARRWMEETCKKVRQNNFMLQHDEHDWMIADIDREVVGENAILECKTASPFTKERWADDNIPITYTVQCLHYMAVTGAEKCYLACLIFGQGVEFREIDRDEEAIEALIRQEKQFWEDYVVPDVMPPADGSKAADEAIKEMYRGTDPDLDAVILDGSLERYDEINALMDDLTKEKREIEQSIKTEMKEAEIAEMDGRRITWKLGKGRKSVDTKALEKDHPDIYEEYVKIGEPVRTFRIGKKKEEK